MAAWGQREAVVRKLGATAKNRPGAKRAPRPRGPPLGRQAAWRHYDLLSRVLRRKGDPDFAQQRAAFLERVRNRSIRLGVMALKGGGSNEPLRSAPTIEARRAEAEEGARRTRTVALSSTSPGSLAAGSDLGDEPPQVDGSPKASHPEDDSWGSWGVEGKERRTSPVQVAAGPDLGGNSPQAGGAPVTIRP